MTEDVETRVGGVAILRFLRELTLEYINTFTVNGKYIGEKYYLVALADIDRSLNPTQYASGSSIHN